MSDVGLYLVLFQIQRNKQCVCVSISELGVLGCNAVCVHVLATTKRLEIYWGGVFRGAMLDGILPPSYPC